MPPQACCYNRQVAARSGSFHKLYPGHGATFCVDQRSYELVCPKPDITLSEHITRARNNTYNRPELAEDKHETKHHSFPCFCLLKHAWISYLWMDVLPNSNIRNKLMEKNPFRNHRLKIGIASQNGDLVITLHPVKTFMPPENTSVKTASKLIPDPHF